MQLTPGKEARISACKCSVVAPISKAVEVLRQAALILSASGILQRCEKSELLRTAVSLVKAGTPTFNSS